MVRSPDRWLRMQPKSELGGKPFTIKFADVVLTRGPFYWSASTQTIQSIRFLANRLTAFVIIRSVCLADLIQ